MKEIDYKNKKKRTDLAKELGVHVDTVTRWGKAGKHGLKLVKIGGLVFADVTDFNPEEIKGVAQ